MSTPIRVLLMLLAWLVFSFLAYEFCIRPACCGGTAAAGEGAVVVPGTTDSTGRRYAIDTRYGDAAVFTNAGFEQLRDRLAGELQTAGNRLEITGLYYESEPRPAGFDNLGFARATRIRELLAEALPTDRIQIRARALEDEDGMREGYFDAAVYDIETSAADEATAGSEPTTEDATVEELDDRIIVRFPFNDARKEFNPEVDTYIRRLAERLQSTRERVRIVGHTDNVGDEAFNQRLGLQRADFIKQELVQLGVDAGRIDTESRGETQPVDSNETETGRSNNRRAELRIVAATN